MELQCPYTPLFISLLSEAALALSPVLLGSVGPSLGQALMSPCPWLERESGAITPRDTETEKHVGIPRHRLSLLL